MVIESNFGGLRLTTTDKTDKKPEKASDQLLLL